MTAIELVSTITAFFTLVIGLLAFLQSSITKITAMSASDRSNKLAELALKISLREHKMKVLPELVAYYEIKKLSIDNPNESIINLVIKCKTLSGAKLVLLDLVGSFTKDVDLSSPIELALNNELEIPLLFREGIFEKIRKNTVDYIKGYEFGQLERESEFNRLVRVELNQMHIWLGFRDELENNYIMPMKYQYTNLRNSISGEFRGEAIARPDLNVF